MIWARKKSATGFVLVPIETCAEGKGDIGLSPQMFAAPGDMMTAESVSTKTRFRLHREHCPGEQKKRRGPYSLSPGRAMGKARPA